MSTEMCVLCNTKSNCHVNGETDRIDFECPNCGPFGIIEEGRCNLPHDKFKISSIIKERHLKGHGRIIVTYDNILSIQNIPCLSIESILSLYPKKAVELIDRVLLNLSNFVDHPADRITIDDNAKAMLFARDKTDMLYILQELADSNYVTKLTNTPGGLSIKAKGWERIAFLTSDASGSNQAFVAMWFSDETKNFYNNAIRPAIEHDGMTKCVRIDKSEHNNKICDQIIAEIRKSKYLVADFTGNRGGVYFEAGFAMGLGIPVIWTVHLKDLEKVHFDTRQYNHICYESESDLLQKLKNRIRATIPNRR